MGKFQENFNTITNIIILVFLLFTSLVYADSNGIWHRAEDVRPGFFGSDEANYGDDATYYTFNNPFRCIKNSYFEKNVTIRDTLKVDVIKPNNADNVEIQLG